MMNKTDDKAVSSDNKEQPTAPVPNAAESASKPAETPTTEAANVPSKTDAPPEAVKPADGSEAKPDETKADVPSKADEVKPAQGDDRPTIPLPAGMVPTPPPSA